MSSTPTLNPSPDQLASLPREILLQKLYQLRPDLYAEQVLRVRWWAKQKEIAFSIARNPKTMVLASHGIGKSMCFGGIVNWWVDCFPNSKCVTTAPSARQVEAVLWGEVRSQRAGRPGLLPKAPEIWLADQHWAKGYTAIDEDAFQGVHMDRLLILFDEAVGIRTGFWNAAKGMAVGDNNRWGAIMNPTDVSSEAYRQWKSGTWNVITVSAMEHPNVLAELAGQPIPYPGAVTVSYIEDMITSECEPLAPGEDPDGSLDFEWPPLSGRWYRPNGIFESRVLGRWPSQATAGVWSMAAFERMLVPAPAEDEADTEIGCDVARHGDDYTEIFVRRGRTLLYWERHNGWGTTEVAGRLIALAQEWAAVNGDGSSRGEDPTGVAIKVDDAGVGGGVVDILKEEGYSVVPLLAQHVALDDVKYPDRRSEMWFTSVEMAKAGALDASRLPAECIDLLQVQLFAPTWKQDAKGRRVVEKKADTKKRIKRSPDTADAFNLVNAAATASPWSWPEEGANLMATGTPPKAVLAPGDDEFFATYLALTSAPPRAYSRRQRTDRYDPFNPNYRRDS